MVAARGCDPPGEARQPAFNQGVYGGLRFFDRQEIKHALAYLRLVANPDDYSAFTRVLNLPARGVGNRSLEQVQDTARQRGVSLWQAACANPPAGKAGQGVIGFIRLIEGLRRTALRVVAARW
jgi:DNA helicase-2/ATP-dependent DNA helicase PcrA